ncbi:alpha/beta fold hydrolase [Smaragdicoccus niigatensis]|uniref:alpha/beta fold hydrolase n=1 Tax=Smaragdicoccus niigatensis TaxID=359359 RepID=UPI000362B558|nr:alpha/beta hydrolase [Smaragdicoccus niigatensis]
MTSHIEPVPETFLGHDGLRLAADRWPTKTVPKLGTVLFLHGGGQTRHSWGRTARRMAESGWEAITLDARGHGDSEWAPSGRYALDDFAGDLRSVVAAIGEAPVLIGASLGGITSLVTEGENPGTSTGLVLVDIAPRIEAAGRDKIIAFMASAPNGFASLEEVADAVQAYNPHRERPQNLDGLRKNVRLHRDGRWYWHWDPRFLDVSDEPKRDMNEDRLYEAARRVQVPTLLVRGKASDVVTPEGAAELLELIPTASSVEVSAGHMVAGDDNDVFTTHLAEFLSERVRG